MSFNWILAAALGWGLVNVPVATFRGEPRQSAELETQAPMGTPVQILEVEGEWRRAMLPDSVVAWVNESGIVEYTDSMMTLWRRSDRYVVTSFDEAVGLSEASGNRRERVTSLVNGSIVVGSDSVASGLRLVYLPDGRRAFVEDCNIKPFDQWASELPDMSRLMDFARSMMDVPYLWGGTSTKMNDCSGFTKICYSDAAKVILPRNSGGQAVAGMPTDDPETLATGDLLFFVNPETGRVNHVGIYDSDGWFIHSSGCVHVNSLDPDSPAHSGKVFSHARRIVGADGAIAPDIILFRNHPWYFSND